MIIIFCCLLKISLFHWSEDEADSDGGGAFTLGDCVGEDTCIWQNLFVNAWMPLPEPYRREGKG